MDSKKRHELETNDLREFLDNFKDFWDKNGNSILITLIVVVGGYTAWNFYKKNKVEKVESAVMALSEATNGAYLMSVAEEHPSVRHIAWQRAGDAYLEEARAAAIKGEDSDVPKLLDSAASAYQRVVDDEDHAPEFRINALLGLATTAEMRGKWDEAKGFYDRAYDLAGDQFVRLAVLAQTGRDGLDDLRHPIAFGPDLPDNPADIGMPMDPNDLTGDGIPDLPGQTPGVDPLFPDGPILPDPIDGDSETPTPGFDPLLQPNGGEQQHPARAMNQPFHPESAEALARAKRYHAQSLEDLEESGAERMRWTMTKDSSLRLDKYVQGRLKGISRSQVQKLIDLGAVTVNGSDAKPSQKLRGDDVVEVVVPPKPADDLEAEDIPLHILYEDEGFIAINKQAGFIVHPARSHLTGTMLNALAWHFQHHPGNTVDLVSNDPPPTTPDQPQKKDNRPSLSSVGEGHARPGVIHRLDMNTTGVILFGKQDESHWLLAKQFEDRTNTKAYLAVVHGNPKPLAGTIEEPLGKHPTIREGQAVRNDSTGKHALTLYRVREQYDGYALVEVQIKTGRTHQIRVHMQYIGHPIVGDLLYGGELVGPREIVDPPHPAGARPYVNYARPKAEGKKLEQRALDRIEQGEDHPDGPMLMHYPALHAGYLQVRHPLRKHTMTFTAPLHEPMLSLVRELRRHPHPNGLQGIHDGAIIDMDLTVPGEQRRLRRRGETTCGDGLNHCKGVDDHLDDDQNQRVLAGLGVFADNQADDADGQTQRAAAAEQQDHDGVGIAQLPVEPVGLVGRRWARTIRAVGRHARLDVGLQLALGFEVVSAADADPRTGGAGVAALRAGVPGRLLLMGGELRGSARLHLCQRIERAARVAFADHLKIEIVPAVTRADHLQFEVVFNGGLGDADGFFALRAADPFAGEFVLDADLARAVLAVKLDQCIPQEK